jgi:hypothetical protein
MTPESIKRARIGIPHSVLADLLGDCIDAARGSDDHVVENS